HTRFSRDWSSDVCSSDLRKLISRFGLGRFSSNAAANGLLRPWLCSEVLLGSVANRRSTFRAPRDRDEAASVSGSTFGVSICTGRSEERRGGKECRARRTQ